ncbi:MAG: RNA polymerase sigma factor [Ekhidna sp.]
MSSDFYTNYILPHSGIIIKICRAYTSSNDDFEDYYQEVCLQIWRSHEKFRGQSKWSTWIYRLSLNVCLTLYKKHKNRSEKLVHSDHASALVQEDTEAFSNDDLNQLYNGIKKLSETDRAIIILYLEGKKNGEIAQIIGTNANNIGVKVLRIKERLKKIITENQSL